MKKPLVIGERLFKYKKDALLYYKNILNSYEFNESLSDEHYEDLINLYNIEHNEKPEEEVIDRRYFPFERNHFGTEIDVFSKKEVDNGLVWSPGWHPVKEELDSSPTLTAK